MSRFWRFYIPGYVLTLPLTLVALVYALFVGGHSWKFQDGCITFVSERLVGSPGGQCWSPFIGFASEEARKHAPLQVHERGHVVQAFVCSTAGFIIGAALLYAFGGPLWLSPLTASLPFALLYAACFLVFYATHQHDEQPGWKDDYRRNPFEKQAYERQSRFQLGHLPNAWGAHL